MKFFLLLAVSLFGAEQINLKRDDGSEMIVYLDFPAKESVPIVILIPGAQQESSLRLHNNLKDLFLAIDFAVASIEKRGIGNEKIDARTNTLDERESDHALFLAHMTKTKMRGWNGKWALVGQGEGGRVAAALAAHHWPPDKDKNLLGLVLIEAGGGWPPVEEALYAFRQELVGSGFSPQYVHSFLVQAREQFDYILKNNDIDGNLFNITKKYWLSLIKNNLLDCLVNCKRPTYYIYADSDDRLPIESANYLVESLKNRDFFSSKRIKNSGREIIQKRETYQEAVSWLKNL